MLTSHGITIHGSQFWVIHRRCAYGPFDYEWSKDFCGVEMHFAGQKFGEYCGIEELFADLSGFQLPKSVVEVAAIVMGSMVASILSGIPENERPDLIDQRLKEYGYPHFRVSVSDESPHN